MYTLLLAVFFLSAVRVFADPSFHLQEEHEGPADQIQLILRNPSDDGEARAASAGLLERSGNLTDALAMWKKALEIDSGMESAYYAIARILFGQGDFAGSIGAVDDGIAHGPPSARLYLSKARAQESLGLWYDARRTLQTGSALLNDPDLLQRYAETEEQYGQNAGPAYRKAVIACTEADEPHRDCLALAHRGLLVSIRDGDRESAEWLAGRLRSAGRGDLASIADEKTVQASRTLVPGGIGAILRVVADGDYVSMDDFFKDFARIVLQAWSMKEHKVLYENVARHFEIIRELGSLGRREGERIQIELSLADSAAREKTRKVLKLLGWELSGNLRIRPAQGMTAAKRQQTTASLALDELAMQEALESQQRYVIEISDDWVPIIPGEAPWNEWFFNGPLLAGGFTQALAADPGLARIYIGISELDEATSDQLIQDFGLDNLHKKYSDLLFKHSAALAVQDGHLLVPGGARAEPVWEKIAGASPSNARQFLRKLLIKDDGKLLAFFSCLMQLDTPHQRFFSSSAARATQFYELFKASPGQDRNISLQDFISQIPLDSEGHIRFPGSPEIWMVAEGGAGSAQQAEGARKRVGSFTAPEAEDAILSRLARTGYLANFIAVVQVEEHRSEPLDEASALLLAQQHPHHREIWPYLTALTGLKLKEYIQLFQLQSRLRALDTPTLNDVLGEFHAIAKLLCLAQQFGRIDEKGAAFIFGDYCERLSNAASTRDFAVAALQAIRELIQFSGMPAENPDRAICDLLLKPAKGNRDRREGYQKILEYQKVPTLTALFSVETAAANLGSGSGALAANLRQLEEALATFPEVEVPKSAGLVGDEKKCMSNLRLDRLRTVSQDFGKAVAKEKPDKNKLESLSIELIGELNPQIRVALTGILYAFYFRPTDLLVSEDPSFLRRHQFVRLTIQGGHSIYEPAYLSRQERAGSLLIGGFGNLGGVSGLASMATSRKVQHTAKPYAAAVLGSIRDTNWQALEDEDLRVVGLRVRTAREWILRSSSDPAAMNALADAYSGLLSANRRAKLLRAVSLSQWDRAWAMLSAAELFFLGEQFALQYGNEAGHSPTVVALGKFGALVDPVKLRWLGPELSSILGCSHPHLLRLSPYENFENYTLPNRLAERSNEFKLYLAELFDRTGTSAAALESSAEPMAIRLFSEIRMKDPKDWRSVLRAYSDMDGNWIDNKVRRK